MPRALGTGSALKGTVFLPTQLCPPPVLDFRLSPSPPYKQAWRNTPDVGPSHSLASQELLRCLAAVAFGIRHASCESLLCPSLAK